MAQSTAATGILDEFLPSYHSPPTSHPAYTIEQQVVAHYPGHQHLVTVGRSFPLAEFLKSQGVKTDTRGKFSTVTFNNVLQEVVPHLQIGTIGFTWKETEFIVYKFTWPQPLLGGDLSMYILISPGNSGKLGETLLNAAYKWSFNVDEEIWTFSNGCWNKEKNLWKTIQKSCWDDLILDEEFSLGLKRDTETFFSSKTIYESLGITWKRGLLLLGPPGNGKTESIKVLLKESGMPSLYVKSFTTNQGAEAGIRAIFEFARRQAPCILVLEDLDSMVNPDVRAFFLNELDGLEENEGILTIATSNHPERIDDAILNRPSRFDVKYMFPLPTQELRLKYIQKWSQKAKGLQNSEFSTSFMSEMAEKTEGFSFAFMKELFVSFLLRIAHDKAAGKQDFDIQEVMRLQIEQLVLQIETGTVATQELSGSGTKAGSILSRMQRELMTKTAGFQMATSSRKEAGEW